MDDRPKLAARVLLALCILPAMLSGCASAGKVPSMDAFERELAIEGMPIVNASGYMLENVRTIADSKHPAVALSARKNGSYLQIMRVENMGEEEAESYVSLQRSLVESLFKDGISPYPGQISGTIQCADAYLPHVDESRTANSLKVTYLLYATERLTFGACADDLIAYRALLSYSYCSGKKELYEIRHFTPKSSADDPKGILSSFSCPS